MIYASTFFPAIIIVIASIVLVLARKEGRKEGRDLKAISCHAMMQCMSEKGDALCGQPLLLSNSRAALIPINLES